MTRKVYKTAQGKMVDIGALQLQNENIRAVGNMSVNARGDLLDAANKPIDTRNRQVGKQYRRQVSNVDSAQVYASRKVMAEMADAEPAPQAPEDFDEDFDRRSIEAALESPDPAPGAGPTTVPADTGGGLAAAIAKARQVKQEPLKTPKEMMKSADGVRKL